jgi:hypothetical protein
MHLSSFDQQQASQPGEPPQGAGIPSKPRDNEYPTHVKDSSMAGHSPKQDIFHIARSSGLSGQEGITSKPAQVDPMVHKLPATKPRLPGAVKKKLKKAWAGQSGTRGSLQLGQETLPLISMGPKDPDVRSHSQRAAP